MKILLFYTGLFTLAISLTHGFFTEQSVVHIVLFHPLVGLVDQMQLSNKFT
ncbi:hypothetical protein [Pseudoalteromonas sp.]|uniref:hypothetical protein n=1 Tax=Pseudoalteromonas sp. TaxID=53249 RepID=UPI00257D2567|nr:hypothetical protein [Pseudoalteromonas sp.]